MRAARRLLAWFDFVALERAGRAEAGSSGDPSLSQLRWKEPGLVASAGGTVLRLRRQGAVVFERKLDTVGTVGLDWGHHLPQDQLVVMGWSRRSGNDECPEGDGLVVARLP
jgi:hypothetical protein